MKVHRYIYTRLSKDQSPKGKNGFQSAFLPDDLLANKEVLEIESHIHFPEGLLIESQVTVFHKQLKGQWYLVLLLLRPLGDVKDEHGRSGTFLCEGFLIGEQDWRPIWRITDLLELIEPYRFFGIDAILNSADVDRAAGKIAGLEVEVPSRFWERSLNDFEVEPEEEMLMVMYNIAKEVDRDLALVVEGPPAEVNARLETCAMFMPESLRPRIGWDAAFDGGKIYFSPLRMFGYSELAPTTGRPATFGSTYGQRPKWTESTMEKLGKPSDPFSHWLLEVCVKPVPKAHLENMFALSEAMASNRPTSDNMPSDQLFEVVNRDAIRRLFIQGLLAQMDSTWAEKLADLTLTENQLKLWMQSYRVDELTNLLEKCILNQSLSPENIQVAPPEKLVKQGSPTLQTLLAMWTHKLPEPAVYQAIPDTKVIPALELIFGRGAHTDFPFEALAAYNSKSLQQICEEGKVAENIRLYIANKVPESYDDFRGAMSRMAVKLNEFESLEHDRTDWLRLLDRALVTTGGDSDIWKAVKALGKTENLDKYPNLKAFAEGEPKFTQELERHPEGRRGYLQCLLDVHGVKTGKLKDMGYLDGEIKKASDATGFLGKVKRLFQRG
jgi:hypothetical protein